MTTKHSNDERAILDRIRNLVPGISEAVEAVQAEHDVTKRLLAKMVLAHAALADLGEIVSQALANSTDLTMAQEHLVSDQRASMREFERLADQTAGARTVIQNLDVWLQNDAPSIRHILEIVDLVKLTEAARQLPIARREALIQALEDAGNE